MPRHILDEVKYDVAMLDDVHHGPHIERDWSNVFAGDFYEADDCTFPVYYYEPDGKGWFTLWRGQALVMIDQRTTRVLGYVLLSTRNYNSLAIRSLITRVCDEHGLPRRGFHFKMGIWKSSKILAGDRSTPLSLPETEMGLRDLELEFRHATGTRAKVIENRFNALQCQMERLPGYAGRDERHDRFERVQKLILQVASGKVEPEGHFMSADQWISVLDEICVGHNAEAQQGKMLAGLSPDAAFAQFQRVDYPQIKFDAACRYLLAHHKRKAKVTSNGITLRFGKNVFIYRNKITGRLVGQTVLAWFNPETPEILSVTDMDRKNAFAVERADALPAMDATPEQLSKAMSQANAHMRHARAYYRTLRSAQPAVFRRNVVDRATSNLGREIQEQQTELQQKQKLQTNRTRNVQRRAEEFGLPAGILDTQSPDAECYTRLLLEAERENEREQEGKS